MTYAGEGMVVDANQFSGQNGGYAIYTNYPQGNASNKVVFSNNMIQIGTAANTAYGIYMGYPTHFVFAHNAINITSGSSTATAFYLFSNNASLYNTVDVINNIFNNPNAGYCGWLSDGGALFPITQVGLNWTINNNVYYGLGTYPYRSNNQISGTFATWQNLTGIGNDSNSFVMNPNFVTPKNLRLNSIPLNDKGKGNTWVAADVDGNLRNATTPDIGVLEFTPPADDAGILSFVLPKAPIDTGLTDVRVLIKNFGAATLTSANVTYVSGATTHTQAYAGNIPSNGTDTVTFSATSGAGATSQQFYYTGGNISMRAYTSSPNTNLDADRNNDTLNLPVCLGMSGTYTINPSGSGARNYVNFNAALAALSCGGALGPVVFEVASGTYNEQLTFGVIPGASAANRIVFRSSTLNRNNVTLTFAPTALATNYVVTFNGTQYVNFEHMTIKNTNATYGRVFNLGLAGSVNSANIGLRNNTIEGLTVATSSDNNALIFAAAGTNATDINIANNNLLNGSMAVSIGGQNIVNNYSFRCQIDSNIITNPYYYGLYLNSRAEMKVRNNIITPSASSFYGIYAFGISSNSEFSYNKLYQPSNYGFYLGGFSQYGEIGGSKVYGNAIMVSGGTSSPLYFTGSSDVRIYNNSINTLTTGTSTTMGAITFGGSVAGGNAVNASQVYIINNAINAGSSPALSITNLTGLSGLVQLDYNTYYSTGATLMYLNGTSYTNATFPTAKGSLVSINDMNSYNGDPAFTSISNLMPLATNANSWVLNGRGIQIYDLVKDLNGADRSVQVSTGAPDIGAFEFTPTTAAPLSTVTGSIGYGNTQHFISFGDTVASVIWGYSGTLPSTVNMRFAPGTLISNRASSPNNNATQDTAAHLMDAYWRMTQAGGSNFTYDVRLRYKPFQLGTIPSETDLKFADRRSTPNYSWWNNNSFATMLDTVANVFGMNILNDTTAFTGTTDISAPLPVKLTSLRATKSGMDAVVSWTTASERNSAYFMVERSFNRANFEQVGRVKAAGNSSIAKKYELVDAQIGRVAKNQTIYYRLKMVDLDGKVEYSPVVSVQFNDRIATAINAYPNPFSNNVTLAITAETATTANVLVVDLMGRTVAEFTNPVVAGDNLVQVDALAKLANGVYFVKVNVDGKEAVTKLIKE
jgi:hypothetical protein